MIPDYVRLALLAGVAIVIGLVGWSGDPRFLPLAILFPALWGLAPTRSGTVLVAAGYFLAASRGLPQGVSTFFGSGLASGIMLWIAGSVMFVLIHALAWTPPGGRARWARYGTAAIVLSVPPFGIVGWAHPITAAGVLFPGWGWLGLGVTASGLLVMTTRFWPLSTFLGAVAFVCAAANWEPPTALDGWHGIDTSFRFTAASQHADYAQHMATIAMVRKAAEQGARAIVLPESAFGIWTATTAQLWARELANLDVTVNGGAVILDSIGYDNAMVAVSGAGGAVIYRERMPVPVAMWQPWATGGANAYFFANPTVHFAGVRIAPLICYEQLLIWPILQSMLFDPKVIVATGNGWWTGTTNIVPVQTANAKAWAALFGLPLVMAFNR